MDKMSDSTDEHTTMTHTSQIKQQIAQRVSSRLRDKRLMENQHIQSSPPKHSISTQPKSDLAGAKSKSKFAIPVQSVTAASTPGGPISPSTIAVHATTESEFNQ